MSKPDAPTPPDPQATAQAQTGTNVSTAVANAYLGHINQVTPDGALDYNQTGSYGWTDPTSGQTYNIPTFTATQTLSPQGQAIKDQTLGTQYNLAGMANAQSGRISNLLSNSLDVSGGPSAGNAQNIANVPQAQTYLQGTGPLQTSLGNQGPIATSYGAAGNYSADRDAATQAAMARITPQLNIQRQQLQQQLADQGIQAGSTAYNNAFLPLNQQTNDAYYGAVAAGDTEQMNLNQMAAQQAAFQNAGQQQGYQEALGSAGLYNQALGQQFQQNATQGQFYNAGQAQNLAQQQATFNASQAARNQWLQEQYANRNQPINEISSLLSGSQVSQPNFVNTPGAQIPTTDIAGITQQNFANQMGIYAQQNQNYNSLMGGLLGLGAGAIKASDKRLKENIQPLGTVLSAAEDKPRMGSVIADVDTDELPIYSYSYKGDPSSTRHIGPMAQDVERQDPAAVLHDRKGTKYIDTHRVMGNILRAA